MSSIEETKAMTKESNAGGSYREGTLVEVPTKAVMKCPLELCTEV